MKKYIISFVLVAILFAFSFERGEATTCPSGYTLFTKNVLINGCLLKVDICAKCLPTSSSTDYDIKIMGFGFVTSGCTMSPALNTKQILDKINSICGHPAWLKANGVCSTGIPDCDEVGTGLGVNISINVCWEKKKIDGKIWYTPCDAAGVGEIYCLERFQYCIDPNTGIVQVTLVQGPSPSGLFYTCTTAEIDVPDPQNNGDTSACFYLNTPCNP